MLEKDHSPTKYCKSEEGIFSAGFPLPPELLTLLSLNAVLNILTSSINPLKLPALDFPTNKPVVPFVTVYPVIKLNGRLENKAPPEYIFRLLPSYEPVRVIHLKAGSLEVLTVAILLFPT